MNKIILLLLLILILISICICICEYKKKGGWDIYNILNLDFKNEMNELMCTKKYKKDTKQELKNYKIKGKLKKIPGDKYYKFKYDENVEPKYYCSKLDYKNWIKRFKQYTIEFKSMLYNIPESEEYKQLKNIYNIIVKNIKTIYIEPEHTKINDMDQFVTMLDNQLILQIYINMSIFKEIISESISIRLKDLINYIYKNVTIYRIYYILGFFHYSINLFIKLLYYYIKKKSDNIDFGNQEYNRYKTEIYNRLRDRSINKIQYQKAYAIGMGKYLQLLDSQRLQMKLLRKDIKNVLKNKEILRKILLMLFVYITIIMLINYKYHNHIIEQYEKKKNEYIQKRDEYIKKYGDDKIIMENINDKLKEFENNIKKINFKRKEFRSGTNINKIIFMMTIIPVFFEKLPLPIKFLNKQTIIEYVEMIYNIEKNLNELKELIEDIKEIKKLSEIYYGDVN